MRHLTSSSCLMAATAAAVALLSACADTRPLQVASPETVMQTTGVGSISAVVTRQDVQFDDKFYFPYEGHHPATKADFPKAFCRPMARAWP
jgi:hypothetical protein